MSRLCGLSVGVADGSTRMCNTQTSIVGSVEKRGISGGQRKRVNIGTELVAFPRVIFLDEPTSGLDATASSAILSGLQRICNLGVMMAMVIHQPRYDIFTLFDSVLLLGPGGRTVYLVRIPFELNTHQKESIYFSWSQTHRVDDVEARDWSAGITCGVRAAQGP